MDPQRRKTYRVTKDTRQSQASSSTHPTTDQIYSENAYADKILSSQNQEPKKVKRRASQSFVQQEVGAPSRRLLRQAQERIFEEHNESDLLEADDIDVMMDEPPSNPTFPYFIASLALVKDAIDLTELTVILMILTKVLAVLISLILMFWVLGRGGGGWWKKKLIRWVWLRYFAALVIEILPFFAIVPATTIFVLMVHYQEKKIVKIANTILEELRKGGFAERRGDDFD